MNTNLLSWLLSTGLDEQRAKLYLVALSKSSANATELAEEMQISRTAIYDNLRYLEERGFVKTVFDGKRKLFVALHPKELYKKFDNQKQQLKDLLPDFLSLYADKSKEPFVQLFKGKYAAREVYEDILSVAKKEYVYFSPPELTLKMVDHSYISKWIKKRVAKKIQSRSLRVKSREIDNRDLFMQNEKYLRQVRYLPGHVDLHSSVYVYENNIAVISTLHEGSAFIIHSPDLSFSFKQIFEFMWSISMRS